MPQPITRRRTGCVICRKRRIRCDESKPSCRNCIRNSQCCDWTIELRFVHEDGVASNQNEAFDPMKDSRKDQQRRLGTSCQDGIVGDGPPLTVWSDRAIPSLSYPEATRPRSSNRNRSMSFSSSHATTRSPDEFPVQVEQSIVKTPVVESNFDIAIFAGSATTEICRSGSARLRDCVALEHASPIPPNLNPNPEGFTNWSTLGLADGLQEILNSDLEVKLLQNYIWECAPWFDAHNGKRNYSKADIPRMMNCPPWRAAALALSAKNLELRGVNSMETEPVSPHLYQLAVRLAIDSISGRFDCIGTLAGCVLLAVYEMMTVSYTDWRLHAQGCASIYLHNCWNGSTGGLISASFWDFARIDIWAAYCSSTSTLIDPSLWFDETEDIMSLSNIDEDTHAQISTWLLGRTVNFIHGTEMPSPHPNVIERESLHEDVSKWEAMGSSACRAVVSRDSAPDKELPFPQILYSTHSSIIAHTMFHITMILLLEYEVLQSPGSHSSSSDTIYYHSRIACGIIATNNHTACLVNSLQPMWICGRHLRTRAEKFAALEILAQIEKRTGWKCEWRSRGLREYWQLI